MGLGDEVKVDFNTPPSEFPKEPEGDRRLYFEYMLIRRSYAQKLKNPKAGLKASLEEHVKYYLMILDEMKRRGLKIPEPTGHPIEAAAKQFRKDEAVTGETEGFHEPSYTPPKLRCPMCGAILSDKDFEAGKCPECGAPLHSRFNIPSLVVATSQQSNALYLVEPHARWIWEGKKALIVKAKDYSNLLGREFFLCGDKVYGKIVLREAFKMDLRIFDRLRGLHLISEKERKAWWPDKKVLYGYNFRFKRFDKPKSYPRPKGVQVFFHLDESLIKKALKEIRFKFLGTCAEEHFPREGCECDQCRDPINEARKHASLLIDDNVMIDAGSDWRGKIASIGAKDIILTHLHPDHAGAFEGGKGKEYKGCRIHVWKGSLKTKDCVKLRENLKVIPHGLEPFKIKGHTYRFVPVKHSVVCPAAAIVIDDRIVYAPDFLAFKTPSILKGKALYIGDGSVLKRDVRRPKDTGHMSMFNQIRMCKKYDVKHVKFTHVGHVFLDHEDLKDTLRIMAKEEDLYPNPNDVYVAKDGDHFLLTENDDIVRVATSQQKAFIKPNKPMWRIFEPEEVDQVRTFSYPAQVSKKVDGLRIQAEVTEDGEEHLRSEDEGYEKRHMLRKIAKELKEKVPKGTILDCEAVMIEHDQPLHRTAIIGYVNSKKYDEEKDNNSYLWVFDVLKYEGKDLTGLPLKERLEYLEKIPTTEHIKPFKTSTKLSEHADAYIVKRRKNLLAAIEKVRRMKGSEGAMIKTLESRYLKHDTQNNGWIKLKNLKEIDCIVVDIEQPKHKKGPKAGQPIEGVYNYHVAAGPYIGACRKIAEELAPKGKVVEWKGKLYAYLGKTFNTSIKAPKGAIIRIWSPEINKYPIKDKEGKDTGCYYFGVFQPKVLEWVREKDRPDGMKVLMRLSSLTLPRTLPSPAKKRELTEELYRELAKPGEPLPPEFYKFKPKCRVCRGVVQRHWPTGKLIPIKEPKEEEEAETREREEGGGKT